MHGTFGGGPPRKGRGPGSGRSLPLAIRLLLREAAFGSVLYAVIGRCPRIDAVLLAAVWTALVLLTRSRGLLDRKDRAGLVAECLVVFCGALAFRSLLVLVPRLLAGR